MAARLTSRTSLFYRILIGIKNSSNFTYRAKRSYSRRTFSIVVRSGAVESPWSTSCGLSMSTEAAQSVPDTNIDSINIAVCIERVPLITPSKSDLEVQYEELQEHLEFEHSSLSEYELIQATMTQKREQLQKDEDNEELKKEVAALDSEYQELREIEEQHVKNITLASRTTEADLSNSRSSPYRRLEFSLFLLTPDKEDQDKWQMPQGNVNPGETLREAAERIANKCVHGDIVLQFMSNAPSGIYRRPEKDGMKPGSPKVFFYHAQLLGSVHKYKDNTWSNCIWASKDELLDYLPLNYYQSISRFLL